MPPRLRPTTVNPSSLVGAWASTSSAQVHLHLNAARSFSSSPQHATRLRRRMWAWLNGPGKVFKQPLPNSTNYLSAYDSEGNLIRVLEAAGKRSRRGPAREEDAIQFSESPDAEAAPREPLADGESANGEELPPTTNDDLRPFPLNNYFMSQRVLSEELKDLVYKRVVEDGHKIVAVSAQLNISMERIAAVIRLKEVEKKWVEKGKSLALPYAKAVWEMLPTTPAPKSNGGHFIVKQHESINDLPVHSATRNQMFYPVPESRHFTRADAAKAFHPSLLPADQRIPHPELILMERARLAGVPRSQLSGVVSSFVESEEAKRKAIKDREERNKARHTKVAAGRRWDFVFEDCSVEDAGQDGRGRRGVGWRYGMPHQDRKKGQVKIPTSVEV